jgi:hypothetical protein
MNKILFFALTPTTLLAATTFELVSKATVTGELIDRTPSRAAIQTKFGVLSLPASEFSETGWKTVCSTPLSPKQPTKNQPLPPRSKKILSDIPDTTNSTPKPTPQPKSTPPKDKTPTPSPTPTPKKEISMGQLLAEFQKDPASARSNYSQGWTLLAQIYGRTSNFRSANVLTLQNQSVCYLTERPQNPIEVGKPLAIKISRLKWDAYFQKLTIYGTVTTPSP